VPSLDLREEFSKEELKKKFREVAARSKTHAILTRPELAQSTGFDEVVFTNRFAIELRSHLITELQSSSAFSWASLELRF
jgi:hypothetical protein